MSDLERAGEIPDDEKRFDLSAEAAKIKGETPQEREVRLRQALEEAAEAVKRHGKDDHERRAA